MILFFGHRNVVDDEELGQAVLTREPANVNPVESTGNADLRLAVRADDADSLPQSGMLGRRRLTMRENGQRVRVRTPRHAVRESTCRPQRQLAVEADTDMLFLLQVIHCANLRVLWQIGKLEMLFN